MESLVKYVVFSKSTRCLVGFFYSINSKSEVLNIFSTYRVIVKVNPKSDHFVLDVSVW